MKTPKITPRGTVLVLLLIFPGFVCLFSQNTFSPENYMEFIEANKTLDAAGLLEQNPAQTTYYSSRSYPAVLDNYSWFDTIDDRYQLTADEKELLSQNFFMVTGRYRYQTWIGALANIYTLDLPLFLSTDFILHTLHQSYDEILKTIEIEMLETNLRELLQGMYTYYPAVYASFSDEEEMLLSLQDVDLYLAVARSLIEDSEVLPQFSSRTKYDEIISAIEAEQMVEMPLFTRDDLSRKLDFSQFKPRGHYTEVYWDKAGEQTLENYFRAMMWLGRIDFLLTAPPDNPWEPGWTKQDLLRMNLSALILNKTLHESGKKELFDKHEEIISFMVGPDDNLTPDELQALSDDKLLSLSDLLNPVEFDEFRAMLNSSDDYGQKIMSNFFYVDPESSDPGQLPVSYKLLGQKFLIDSYVFSEVVYDRIESGGEKVWRPLPDPLDVLSVFGSEDAMALMEDEMAEYKYAYKINQLKYLVDSYDEEFWSQSLYNTWLSGIIELNPPSSSEGFPYFMNTAAWHHEKLNTQLTSWAQLRHDNILYGKQSYTGGTGCSYPYTYVEPYPEFYARLADFAEKASTFFGEVLAMENSDLSSTIRTFYEGYAVIMNRLDAIANKELNREALNDEELIFLKTMINDYMASGPSVSGWVNDLLFPAMDMWDFDFTVADVHTQPTDQAAAVVGHVMHVGNGTLNLGVFLAPCSADPERYICYAGPLSSFHTEVTNNFYRYDDDEWQSKFLEGDYPEPPEWVYAYMADENGKTLTTEKMLKGVVYAGTEDVEELPEEAAYLLAFPNPASDEIRFRFILEQGSEVEADVFDVSGRHIEKLYSGSLQAGEHDLQMKFGNGQSGIYIMQLRQGNSVRIKRFVVN